MENLTGFGLKPILIYQFAGNSLKAYLTALAVFLLSLLFLKIFKKVIIQKIKKIAGATKTEFDDVLIKALDSVGWLFYFILSFYLSIQFLNLPEAVLKGVFLAFLAVFAYYGVRVVEKIIDYGIEKIAEKMEAKFDSSALNFLSRIIKALLWAVAVIIVLQNFGYNVTALAAGLGIGGLAIAFAFQNILEDVFSFFSIYFDKPFRVGDLIVVGSEMGTVKKIGVKSTRIQMLQGEELVVSNKDLTASRIRNFKKMEKRRIVFNFGVIYETSADKLKKIPQIVKKIIDKVEIADLDRAHFTKFGDFSLDFEVVYYLNSNDYLDYMNTQQEINFALKEEFEKENIEMAYPTQTIHLNSNS